jgi:hypothetical protein
MVELTCIYCGNKYFKYPSKAKESKFCSKSCQGKYQSKINNLGKVNHVVWNKGLTALKDIRVRKNSEKAAKTYKEKIKNGYIPKHKGIQLSDERKAIISKTHANFSGKNNPMYGRRGKNAPNYGGKYRGKQGYRNDLPHNVRSRWEANFARVMLYEGIDYEWEPQTFELTNGSTYTPDFYDNTNNCFWEVKAVWTEKSLSKFNQFKKDYPDYDIKVLDKKKYYEMHEKYANVINWEYDKRGRI